MGWYKAARGHNDGHTMTDKFHERFNIHVPIEEARKRFVNRIHNEALGRFFYALPDGVRHQAEGTVITILGIENTHHQSLTRYIGDDFRNNVRGVEALFNALNMAGRGRLLEPIILNILSLSEVDLGIRWHEGRFAPSGSPLLDEKLVNDVLNCLKPKEFEGVLKPFQKGLEDLIQSINIPARIQDVVTEMYEALEALAKIVTGRRDKDLSSNAELFIKSAQVSDAYKPILKEYIAHGNKIRHAGKDGQPKQDLTRKEVESFVYLTGVFIRLAVIEEAQA